MLVSWHRATHAALCHVQVQTIKTSIEAACLLLRIDDIVSGIAKKSRGSEGPQMQQQPQTEDADGVSRQLIVVYHLCSISEAVGCGSLNSSLQ